MLAATLRACRGFASTIEGRLTGQEAGVSPDRAGASGARTPRLVFVGASLLLAASVASAQTVAPPFAGTYSVTVLGSISGLPTSYGGLVFKAGDPNTILIGGAANAAAGRFYEVPVTRGAGGHIATFGTPVARGFGGNNDGGVAYGPGGVLFYSKYQINQVGQVRPGSNADDKVVNLAPLSVAASPGALSFVPPGFGGAGRLKLCSYSGGQFYDVAVAPDGSGTYDLTSATLVATLAGGPEGFIFAPAGSPLFPNPTILVTEYGANKVAAYDADANGNPVVATRRDFVTGLTGGEGAAIDPVTGDFLFSTFGSSNRVIQVRGFTPPPPPATVALASSVNPSSLGQSVTFTATVTSGNGSSVTGTVAFRDNGTDVAGCAAVAVSGGTAACTTTALTIGSHPIEAAYGGNATNGAGSGTLTQVVLDPPPGGVGGGLRLWLDAAETRTLFGDAACTTPVTTGGSSVACWADKSSYHSDVVDLGAANGEPTWLTGQFNGKPALEFSKAESDTLRHTLASSWTSNYTEFLVFQQIGTPIDYDSFFSNGDSSTGPYHQITHLSGSFKWFHGSTQLTIEPWSNELKLYAARGGSSDTQVFADGASKGTAAETGGRTFAQYRINQNRGSDRLTNSKIAEVIVYDRALTDCEMEDVSLYLGVKYGRDFLNVGSAWDFTAPFVNDVNGIASIAGACPAPKVVNSAQSSVVTIDQPSHLLAGERLLIGHDGAGLSTSLDVPAGFDARVTRIWRADANQAAGMAVRVAFDLTSVPAVDVSVPAQLALLVDSDATMNNATPVGGAVVNGRIVTFTGVTFAHGQHFTLAHALPPGIFVQNPGPVSYPSLAAPVVVAPNLRVSFLNPATPIDQAKVDISASFQSGADVLGILGQSGTSGTVGGLAWSWDATAGVLTLTGAGTPATYQAALRQVTYRNTSGSPSTAQRKLTYSLGSGLRYPGTGHFYEFVPDPGILQAAARTAAAARTYFGIQGYLTTVTSQGETDFIIAKLGGRGGWIGASDAAVADTWRWITGPEGLEDGGNGRIFYQGSAPSGTAVGGSFVNWNPGEPNRSGDVAYFIKVGSSWGGVAGKWDDIPDNSGSATGNIDGYVVEYGGLPGDATPHLADDAFVNVLVPALALTKTAGTDPVTVATDVTYTLAYQNTGAAAALNVVLHDAIPTGATFVSATGGGTLSGGTVTWSLGALAAGASGSVTVTVRAPSAAGTMTNTADLGAGNAATVQATESVSVIGPTLTLRKTGPAGVAAGAPITYTISYGNGGTGAAAAPVLVDTFPAGTAFASSVPLPSSQTATSATWNLAAIAPGGSGSVSLTLNAPAAPGTIVNSAQLSATAATPVTATATSRVTTCGQANLACLQKTFLPGSILVTSESSALTLSLENGTDGASRNVSFTDTLPAGLVLAAVPATPQCGGATVTGAAGGSTLTVANAPLGPGNQSCAITASVRGTTVGSKLNDATRFSGTTSVDVSGARATVVVTEPVLALTKTAAPTSVVVGGTVTYQLQYRNTGNATATGAQLVDSIPAGATYVSSSPAGTLGGGSVTWSLGDLAAGASGSVSVVVTAPGAPTTLANTATLSAANATQAQASASVNVFGEPAFTFTLADGPDPVRAGANLTWTATVTNTGTLAAAGTTLRIPIPANTTFVSTTGGGSPVSGPAAEWSLGSLGVGQTVSVTLTVNVNSPLADGTVLTTTGQADATNLASPANATAQTTVLSEPQLSVTLTAAPPLVQGGETVAFTIGFGNQGTDVAAGATLTFTAPASTTIVAAGGGTVAGPTVTWNVGDLAVGQSGSLAVTVRADTGVPNGTVLTGNAAIGSTTTCGSPAAPCAATADATVVVATAPILRLEKTGPAYVAAGGTVTYELRTANDGNLDAQNVVLTDLLPVDTEFVSATAGGTCGDGQTPPAPCAGFTDGTYRVVWTLGTVARGTGTTVQVTLRSRSPLADGTPLVNTATLASTDAGGPQPASATLTTRVTSRPALTLTKTGKSPVAAGSQVVYTLTYENAGADQATGVVLTDHVPAGTTFVSATGGGVEVGGLVTWNLGTVAAGVSGSVDLTLAVGAAVPSGTVLVNNASIESNELGAVSAQARTTVLSTPIPELTSSSTPAAVVAAGQSASWVLDFRNSGSVAMTNAVLTDEVPLGLTPLFISGGGTFDPVTGRITWNLGTVAAGASGSLMFGIPVPIGTPDGTPLANTATFGADNALPVTSAKEILVTSAPVLEVRKDAPPYALAGDPFTYVLEYLNTGNFTAYNVVLTDALPPQAAYVSATGSPAVAGNVVTWSLGDLAPGAGGSVSLTVAVASPLPDGTALANGATLEATNATTVSTLVTSRVISAPLLSLQKSGPAQVAAGGQVGYALSLANLGTDVATNVVLTDVLPTDTTYVSSNPAGSHSAGVVTWNVGSLPVGGSVTYTVVANVASPLPNGTQLVNTASARATENPPVSVQATTTVTSAPLLVLTKTAAAPVVAPNATMTFTITYRNDGNENSANTVLTDYLPANATHFAHTNNGATAVYDPVANTVTWNLGTVAVGASGSEQVTVLVPAGTPNASLILNSATISGDDALSATVQAPVVVGAQPALRHVKTPIATIASPGQQVTFTLEYQNVGNGDATGATLVDIVPAGLTFVSAGAGGVWNTGSRTVTWDIGSLAAGSGGSATVTLVVDTASPPVDGAVVTNTSYFDTSETQSVTSIAEVAISAPVLVLSKSGAPDPVSAGSQVAWLIQYRNAGTGTATGVSIRDTLAAELAFVSLTGNGSYDAGTRTVTWTLPSLAPGASGSVTVLCRVAFPLPNGTLIRNDAFVDSLQTSSAAAAAIATVQSAPALTLTKVGSPDPVAVSGVVTYTLTVQNAGNDGATRVVVVDRLPAELLFQSASGGGVYDPVGRTVTWDLGDVPAGSGPVYLTLQARVNAALGTTITNVAEVSSFESPTLAVSSDVLVGEAAQIPSLSSLGLAALALALALAGTRLLRGAAG